MSFFLLLRFFFFFVRFGLPCKICNNVCTFEFRNASRKPLESFQSFLFRIFDGCALKGHKLNANIISCLFRSLFLFLSSVSVWVVGWTHFVRDNNSNEYCWNFFYFVCVSEKKTTTTKNASAQYQMWPWAFDNLEKKRNKTKRLYILNVFGFISNSYTFYRSTAAQQQREISEIKHI